MPAPPAPTQSTSQSTLLIIAALFYLDLLDSEFHPLDDVHVLRRAIRANELIIVHGKNVVAGFTFSLDRHYLEVKRRALGRSIFRNELKKERKLIGNYAAKLARSYPDRHYLPRGIPLRFGKRDFQNTLRD
jgi:hypothetical protein